MVQDSGICGFKINSFHRNKNSQAPWRLILQLELRKIKRRIQEILLSFVLGEEEVCITRTQNLLEGAPTRQSVQSECLNKYW